MRDYSQELGIFFREIKHGTPLEDGEREFLVQWERLATPTALGTRRYAVLGGEFHILKLLNRWNRSSEWKYTLLPDIYKES